jgi:phage shock protein PspC (stress-responsive transcriptional regulator)
MLGGVAGGLAAYFGIDSTIARVLFILVVFFGGSGIIAYIILWIVVPEEPYKVPEAFTNQQSSPHSGESVNTENAFTEVNQPVKDNRSLWGGIILISLGTLFLLDNYVPRFSFSDYWPLILIGVGVGLLLNAKKKNYSY